MKRIEIAKAVQALHERPELRDVFPLGDVVDTWVRWSA